MSIVFELGISSVDAIQLYPEFDFKDEQRIIESSHRTQTGRQYSYKWGDYEHFEFSLNYVQQNNASIISSWWSSRTELLFFISGVEASTQVYSVMIIDDRDPLSEYNKPYEDYRRGKLTLESY